MRRVSYRFPIGSLGRVRHLGSPDEDEEAVNANEADVSVSRTSPELVQVKRPSHQAQEVKLALFTSSQCSRYQPHCLILIFLTVMRTCLSPETSRVRTGVLQKKRPFILLMMFVAVDMKLI